VNAGEGLADGVFVETGRSNGKPLVGWKAVEPGMAGNGADLGFRRAGRHDEPVGHGETLLLQPGAVPGFSADERGVGGRESVEQAKRHDPNVLHSKDTEGTEDTERSATETQRARRDDSAGRREAARPVGL
jgi:hypothetical protein